LVSRGVIKPNCWRICRRLVGPKRLGTPLLGTRGYGNGNLRKFQLLPFPSHYVFQIPHTGKRKTYPILLTSHNGQK